MKPDAPEFTIARLIANAQAMVIKISHEMYLVYLRAGKSLVHAIITVVTAAKKNISSSTPGNSSSIKGNSPTVAPTIINTNKVNANQRFFLSPFGSVSLPLANNTNTEESPM